MRVLRLVAAVAALLAVNPTAKAEDGLPAAYICAFENGNSWNYDAGAFKSVAASAIHFDISKIDLEKQTADLTVDGKAAGSLRVVRALNANSFLEVVDEGFLNLTTVYDLDPASGTYPAVHSRHFGVVGHPLFAQYAGSCKAK
jgi:hypothetical protein